MKKTAKLVIYIIVAILGLVFGYSLKLPTVVILILPCGFVLLVWMILTLGGALFGAGNGRQNSVSSQQIYQEMNARKEKASAEYEKICRRVGEVLKNAEKPARCNVVRFNKKPFQFPDMVSYQYMADWEVWKNSEKLYLYQKEVEMYPEGSDNDAPEIWAVDVKNIQYFKMEGNVETNTYVTGGKVTQDKRTGKVSQTALKNKTVKSDSRCVKMSVVVDGVVETLEFNKESYDVFLLLIPEKEYNRVVNSSKT